MDRNKARNISVVLVGLAVTAILLPVFGVYNDRLEGLALAVLILLASAFFVRELGDK